MREHEYVSSNQLPVQEFIWGMGPEFNQKGQSFEKGATTSILTIFITVNIRRPC